MYDVITLARAVKLSNAHLLGGQIFLQQQHVTLRFWSDHGGQIGHEKKEKPLLGKRCLHKRYNRGRGLVSQITPVSKVL